MGWVIYPQSGHLSERSHADEGDTKPVEQEASLLNVYVCSWDVCSWDACPWPSIALNWWAPSPSMGTMLYTVVVCIGLGSCFTCPLA